jgi:hypothetical protein
MGVWLGVAVMGGVLVHLATAVAERPAAVAEGPSAAVASGAALPHAQASTEAAPSGSTPRALAEVIAEHERAHHHEQAAWKAPLTWGCKGERSYLAQRIQALPPTPSRLARSLEQTLGEGLTLVIREEHGELRVTLSATELRGGKRGFPAAQAPSFSRLVDGFGTPPGVSSEAFLERGFLPIRGGSSPGLEIEQINWRAVEGASCDEVQVHLYASVPRTRVNASLLDPADPPLLPLHLAFKATLTVVERSLP